MNKDIEIFDDLVDSSWLQQNYDNLLVGKWNYDVTGGNRDLKYPPTNIGNGDYRFWGLMVMKRLGHDSTYLFDKDLGVSLIKFFDWFNKVYLNKALLLHFSHVNGQTVGQDGGIHLDDNLPNPYTVMLFSNPTWKPSWGGQFEMFDKEEKNITHQIEYIPGRIVVFKGDIPHRGLGPTISNILRTSIVWKCSKI